ncbi:MAG TPA: YdeI/OmpD-associated family protein [Chitinophagaceae bacterium]|nr:YdeI/OmpD-associated family protein [Chitinophagaceae bacterium]
MIKKDKRIDEYIARSEAFSKPILLHIRKLVHQACPEVQENIKWGFPHFDYKGIMCSMASFKNHCAFGFWKYALMKDAQQMADNNENAMGHLGKIKSLQDLPSDKKIIAWVKEAMQLNDKDIKLPERKKKDKKEIVVPDALQTALNKNKKALEHFTGFPPSHKREYIEWITEAKTDETRNRRIAQTVEWVAEGKGRNWKYERK